LNREFIVAAEEGKGCDTCGELCDNGVDNHGYCCPALEKAGCETEVNENGCSVCKSSCQGVTSCSGQTIGTKCCDSNGNEGMCDGGTTCKVCAGGEVYIYQNLGSASIKCCSAPKKVVSGKNDLEGSETVYNCCEEGFFIPEKDSKIAFSGHISYCPEQGKMMIVSATGGIGNSCVTNSGIFSGYYDLGKVDTTGWSFDDYKSWASNRGGYSEDCNKDYNCGDYEPCVVMDISPVGSCSGQSDKMPCTSGSKNGVCISGECCTTPSADGKCLESSEQQTNPYPYCADIYMNRTDLDSVTRVCCDTKAPTQRAIGGYICDGCSCNK
jgi:hypothetical protein